MLKHSFLLLFTKIVIIPLGDKNQ